MESKLLLKRHHEITSTEVEHEPKRDRDGQGGQSLLPDGEHDEREAQAYQDGDEAGESGVPVAIRRRLANQHRIEDEVAEPQLHSAVLFIV